MRRMTGWAWVQLLSAASGLTVALLAVLRGGRSALALPLTLLAADQFAWNVASLGLELTHDPRYAWVGAVTAPLFAPIAFQFVATFLGRRRALLPPLAVAYTVFGAQSVVAAVQPLGVLPVTADLQAGALLLSSVPIAAFALVLVARHRQAASTALERWRATVLIAALATVPVLLTTDLLADMGFPLPRLATLGSFVFNVTLTWLTVGLGLFPNVRDRLAAVLQAVVFALFVAVTYLLLFALFREQVGVLITTSTALSLFLAAAAWFFITGTLRARAGLERFASLGRFSAQMAHDLKNPLAAAKGAAEYLVEEMRRAAQPQQQEFAQLIVQQLVRLGAVIDRYQRLSTLQPELASVDLNALVGQVLSLQAFGSAGVRFTQALSAQPITVQADRDLLASALENLVKNAVEAMPQGGEVTVSTHLEHFDEPEAVLSVRDGGQGMDPRAREQAFELFFTTKATGSGLGLAFVQQVARAHGGRVRLQSREGSGTLVEVVLPCPGGA